ncbi:MAG TPA: hypothetical protein VKQ05_08240, partial [Gemmatimonadales bacterium]|nr:hypothetical protein [Gemmatimonadales bacterium]
MASTLSAQNQTDGLIAVARTHIAAHQFDQAETVLNNALETAGYMMDSVHVYIWRAILGHMRGSDSLAHGNFRAALQLYP